MNDADRKRLVAILGMLGSAAAGERDNAARLAEQFRRQHGMTWAQLFEPQTVYVERVIERPAPPTEPEPPPVWPDYPPYQPPTVNYWAGRRADLRMILAPARNAIAYAVAFSPIAIFAYCLCLRFFAAH